jgi:hypothetical protein
MRVLIIAITLAIAGCSTSAPILRTDYSGLEAGMLALSLSRSTDSVFDKYGFYLRSSDGVDPDMRPWLRVTEPSYEQDKSFRRLTSEDGLTVTAVCMRLPIGRYTISNFFSTAGIGATATAWGTDEPVQIRVEVKPGEVTYVGWFHAVNNVKLTLGIARILGARFEVLSRVQRDSEALNRDTPCANVTFADNTATSSKLSGPGVIRVSN